MEICAKEGIEKISIKIKPFVERKINNAKNSNNNQKTEAALKRTGNVRNATKQRRNDEQIIPTPNSN